MMDFKKCIGLFVLVAIYLVVQGSGQKPLDKVCLGCICHSVTGCDLTLQCKNNFCGLFKISRPYWEDAGRPTVPGVSPDSEHAYSSCTRDTHCAANAVQGYMAKFKQDCNDDGVVDCYDYLSIHMLGNYGCKGGITGHFARRFYQCMADIRGRGR